MPSTPLSQNSSATALASRRRVREYLTEKAAAVEKTLERLLPIPSPEDGGVAEAMRYTALSPGKRIRPIVFLAAAESYSTPASRFLPSACALEMVHACSLILDDLPCMDDADLRRGRPANHRVFGEDKAILAAFGLLNLAFGVVSADASLPVELRGEVASLLSQALGTRGLIGGQALDLASSPTGRNLHELEQIHSRKTGSLFIASVEMGALLGRAPDAERQALILFAKNLGLAYQIVDDLLDATSDSAVTGKHSHSDRRGNFVSLSGVEGARRLAEELSECALDHLSILGSRAALLRGLALHLTGRTR
ncbi:MAG: polyprenyl synthetase family protein [Acidobacteria bacterium]|nr:polyprenyl synthetase family protein [Acidobacteriota bacterium]